MSLKPTFRPVLLVSNVIKMADRFVVTFNFVTAQDVS